ncbi:uncharacterized protein LOC122512616 [Leptopilina heterotoma]|uniref:uncharacterized protein LOC122512616 n=1 Tax=Leptopilina heterotoma TaxID=63436 RepID=UPI001CA9D42E|nr:uncharacterized protein LOC122512616 [Leptopilina heterotoma]
MMVSNFISPLQAVQSISIFTYLNTLSDFLLAGNFLNPINEHQPIPIVNSLFNYLLNDYQEDRHSIIHVEFLENDHSPKINNIYNYSTFWNRNRNEIIKTRKEFLARKLIENTDLYGSEENEALDEIFIDALYSHLILTLVFEKYTNIYGFLIDVVRKSTSGKINSLHEQIFKKLSKEIFLTENGYESKLEDMSVRTIIQEFIYPLLPKANEETNLASVDYIYGSAGSTFVHSIKSKRFLMMDENNGTKKVKEEEELSNYVTIAHAVEQSVIVGQLEKSALAIFALPALLNYVYNHREDLRNRTLGNIVNNSTLGSDAYKILFRYLSAKFDQVRTAESNDYRLQFYLTMMNFQNRTMLAREMIRNNCPNVKEKFLEQEVLRYKNSPDDYRCKSGEKLENLNRIYQDQVNNAATKYLVYEKKSIRNAFGEDLIKSIEANEVEISKGLVHYVYDGLNVYEKQLVKGSADLFRFRYLKNETSVYYAVIREDNNLSVLVEDDGATGNCTDKPISDSVTTTTSTESGNSATSTSQPSGSASSKNSTLSLTVLIQQIPKSSIIHCNSKDFYQKLGLTPAPKLRENNFLNVKKKKEESFDKFLTRISEERATLLNKTLAAEGYDQTRKEWWKDFGLSLIPFYTCRHAVVEKKYEEAELSCLMDAITAIPVVREFANLFSKLTTSVTKTVIHSAGTTFSSLAQRMTVKEVLLKLGPVIATEVQNLSRQFTMETFKKFGLSLFRYLDPGFEFIYTIGKSGIRSIITLVTVIRKYISSLESIIMDLLATENKIENSIRKVGTISNWDIFVNSLTQKNSGYGYKFLQLPDKRTFQLRRIQEYNTKLPVVLISEEDETLCMTLNIKTGEVRKKVFHLKTESYLYKTEFRVESFHNSRFCKAYRLKRTPTTFSCLRNILLERREITEDAAMDFVQDQTELTKDVVQKQLRNFIFPDEGELQLKFVQDWWELISSGNKEVPNWSREYQIENAELFESLRYSDRLDGIISKEDAFKRIGALGLGEKQNKYFPNLASFMLIQTFNKNRVFESLTFEDYVALQHYMRSGYAKIASTTLEAKYMREAIYRLAIRQGDNPFKECTLFRGTTKTPEAVDQLFFTNNKEVVFNRFTSSTSSREVAKKFLRGRADRINVLYEMKFSEPFLRANFEEISFLKEYETILLPGSVFDIKKLGYETIDDAETLVVQMSFNHEKVPKHKSFKNTMEQLAKLKKDFVIADESSDVL